ncbi:glycosyltransferase family 4 protein [Candidatus Parcubacteria bacterium]|nr:glycosyltransferase family 4 protein [Candidatus Parcubacteria bacterium]
MKILFLYDFPLWGSGSGTYVRNSIQELVKLNHKIGIVCPEKRRFMEDKIKQYSVNLPQTPVFIGHPELKGSKKYSELSEREITQIYKVYLDATLEAVANFKPDIIHVHHFSLIIWIARYIEALTKIKYVITSHGSCLYNIASDKRYFSLSQDAVAAAKQITVVSADTRMKFLTMFGRNFSKNLHIVPGGIDIKLYPTHLDVSNINKKYRLEDKKMVLFTGRLISPKGVKYLVKAAKEIDGEIFIIGDGPEKQYLLSLIDKMKVKNVHLLGYMKEKDLPEFYYRADVFVTPSVWDEPLGLTILEAMASKTPVVATRKGGIPLLVKSGYNGVFVKHRNSKKIAEAVNKLLKNDELRKTMGENARKTIEEKFTWKIAALKFHRLYKKINRNGK